MTLLWLFKAGGTVCIICVDGWRMKVACSLHCRARKGQNKKAKLNRIANTVHRIEERAGDKAEVVLVGC